MANRFIPYIPKQADEKNTSRQSGREGREKQPLNMFS
jgi:hypothetical protein